MMCRNNIKVLLSLLAVAKGQTVASCRGSRCVRTDGNGRWTMCGIECDVDGDCGDEQVCRSNLELEFEAIAADIEYDEDPCCDGNDACFLERCVRADGNGRWTVCGDECSDDDDCGSNEVCRSNSELKEEAIAAGITYNEDPCCLEKNDDPCFSSMGTVQVYNQGATLIKDLQIGDEVLVGSGEYKKVYTIAHRNPNKLAEFVQIYTNENEDSQPLEITKNHLIFLHDKTNPIPAGQVQVGDQLQVTAHQPPVVVTKISSITRNGFWNPITEDGTLIVDGIRTSTYAVRDLNKNGDITNEYFQVGQHKIIPMHDFIHLLMMPYRTTCAYAPTSFCDIMEGEDYNSYTKFGRDFVKSAQKLPPMIQNVVAISVFILFCFLYLVIMHPVTTIMLSLSGAYLYYSNGKTKNKSVHL